MIVLCLFPSVFSFVLPSSLLFALLTGSFVLSLLFFLQLVGCRLFLGSRPRAAPHLRRLSPVIGGAPPWSLPWRSSDLAWPRCSSKAPRFFWSRALALARGRHLCRLGCCLPCCLARNLTIHLQRLA
jgi:hypothetical protein